LGFWWIRKAIATFLKEKYTKELKKTRAKSPTKETATPNKIQKTGRKQKSKKKKKNKNKLFLMIVFITLIALVYLFFGY